MSDAMTLLLVGLGEFLVGVGVSTVVGRYWFLQGLQLGRDDRALDPGETTGQLPVPAPATPDLSAFHTRPVGQTSGPRHAAEFEPPETDSERTVQFAEGGIVTAPGAPS